jgi:hypothetical protein
MKFTSFLLSLVATATTTSVSGFVAPSQCFGRTASLASSATDVTPFVQGPRIIREEVPILYVYDHCPFCVRVRLALGVKNIKHNLVFLANDDIPTPTKLIGKKISPIFVSYSWHLIHSSILGTNVICTNFWSRLTETLELESIIIMIHSNFILFP